MKQDPFRLFFPLGVLFACLGIAPWVQLLFVPGGYPSSFHRLMMINGFMLSFVCGFLMTAIPRFTKTFHARSWELATVFSSLVISQIFNSLGRESWHHGSACLAIFFLMLFLAPRFFRRQANPPLTFIFVGLGLILWFASNVAFALGQTNDVWRDIFSSGALLSLVLGIGSRLIPALLGWKTVIESQAPLIENRGRVCLTWLLMLVFLISYFSPVSFEIKLVTRSIVVGIFAFSFWHINVFPKVRTPFTWSLWSCSWMIFLSSTFNIFANGQYYHFLHGLLVGGLSLLTLLISLHVVISHSRGDHEYRKNSKLVLIVTILVLVAALTRATATIWPHIYLSHIGYAAATWFTGLLGWLYLLFGYFRSR
jgi:uncharacterized protein involved in response to NO